MKRLIAAFFFSIHGLRATWIDELAFRQEIMASFILIPLAFYYASTRIALILMIGSWGLVIVTELLNSALEAIIDRIGLEEHPLSKKAKDMGSAAVFVALIIATLTWIALLI